MFHIVFNADSNYIKYTAVLIQNIITYIDKSKAFCDFTTTLDSINHNNNIESNKDSKNASNDIESFHFHIIGDDISQDMLNRFKILESSLNENQGDLKTQQNTHTSHDTKNTQESTNTQTTQNEQHNKKNKISLKIAIHTYIVEPSQFLQQSKWGYETTQSYAAYYRILVDKILPKNIEKILYLDTDMLVLCDVRELFSFDMGGKIIAGNSGLLTPVGYKMKFKSLQGKKPLKIFIPRYFCSGLMLIDMRLWRERDVESKSLDFLSKYESHFADQDALNVVVQDSAILPPQYAIYMYQYTIATPKEQAKYADVLREIKIMHCNGPAKAWSNFFYFAPDSVRHLVCGTWWDLALHTSGFVDIFIALQRELQDNAISYCINRLNKKINELESKLYALRHPHKAISNFFSKIF